ncbi:MAG TPA: hypothetical protein VJB06_00300 [archaeon]|nr:hypothetical protein [archaeon]
MTTSNILADIRSDRPLEHVHPRVASGDTKRRPVRQETYHTINFDGEEINYRVVDKLFERYMDVSWRIVLRPGYVFIAVPDDQAKKYEGYRDKLLTQLRKRHETSDCKKRRPVIYQL